MFPDARQDKEMFKHLNLEFNLKEKQITAETAAKDYHGVPHYQYVYDTADKTGIEIANMSYDRIKEEWTNVPATKNSADITADTLSEEREALIAVTTKSPSIDLDTQLTLEE